MDVDEFEGQHFGARHHHPHAKRWDRELSQWQVKLLRTIKDRLSDEDDYPLEQVGLHIQQPSAIHRS